MQFDGAPRRTQSLQRRCRGACSVTHPDSAPRGRAAVEKAGQAGAAAPANDASLSTACRRSAGSKCAIETIRRSTPAAEIFSSRSPTSASVPISEVAVDELVGNRVVGLLALALEVQRLHVARLVAVAEALGEVDVEVLLLGAHAAEIEDEGRANHRSGGVEIAVDRDLDRRADLEVGAAAAPLLEAAGQVVAPDLLDPLRVGEGGDPAVADLGGKLDRLTADRADEDRDLVAQRVEVELQRLALVHRPLATNGDRVVGALVIKRALTGDDLADDLDVLARATPRLRIGDAVPALGDLRAGRAEAEDEAAAGEVVERRAGHRCRGGRARRDLQDRGAELDRLRLRDQPGEDGDDVGAIRLRRPHGLEAGGLRRLHELHGFWPCGPMPK